MTKSKIRDLHTVFSTVMLIMYFALIVCWTMQMGFELLRIVEVKFLTVLPVTQEAPVFIVVENMTRVIPSYDFHFFDPLDHPPRFN